MTIASPGRMNAFSAAMRRQLHDAVHDLDASGEIRVMILTGAGERAFSAGQDLQEAQGMGPSDAKEWVDEWAALYRDMLNLGIPTIAAVNGYAVGAGFQVALMCDFRVASTTARVGMPEVDVGIPCVTGSWALTALVGRAQITDLVLSGRLLGSDEMLKWGLVSQVVQPEELMETACRLGGSIASKSKPALRADTAWLRQDLLQRLPKAQEAARLAHAEAFASGEPQRAMGTFLGKRPRSRRS